MGEKLGLETVSGTLAAGGTLTASVNTSGQADSLYVLVDNTAGGAPAGYSIELEAHDESSDTYMTVSTEGSSASPVTASSWTKPAVPDTIRCTLTNQSGASGDFRLRVISTR